MATQRYRSTSANSPDGRSELLTIMEARAALRVGRTTAYAMAREWRETGGKSGLPVIEVGGQLRVPRRALEELIDGGGKAPISGPQRSEQAGEASAVRAAAQPTVTAARRTPSPRRRTKRATRRRNNATPNQLNLFDPTD